MNPQNRINKTVRDLFTLATDEVKVALVSAKNAGQLNLSEHELQILNVIFEQTINAVFIRGSQSLDRVIESTVNEKR